MAQDHRKDGLSDMHDMHQMTVRVPKALHRQAKAKASAQGTYLTDIVIEALTLYVSDSQGTKKTK